MADAFLGGPVEQRVGESIHYTFRTTPWGSGPSGVTLVVKVGATDVTGTVTSGSIGVVGDTITLPAIQSLTVGTQYDARVTWTSSGGDTFVAPLTILCIA